MALSRFKPLMSTASSSGLSLSYRRFPISGSQPLTPFNRTFALLREGFTPRHCNVILVSRRPNYLSLAWRQARNRHSSLSAWRFSHSFPDGLTPREYLRYTKL